MGVCKVSSISKINLYHLYRKVDKYYLKLVGHFHFYEMSRIGECIETVNKLGIAWGWG